MKFTYFFQMVDQIIDLEMDPYFDLAHVILCAVAVREDISRESQTFRTKYSISSWTSTILITFAGSMVTNGLCGECILAPLANNKLIVMTTIVWYLVFYSPFDIGYKTSNFFPVKFMLVAMKEVRRTGNIYKGILLANKLFPEAYLIIIIIGTVKGNGAGFMRLVEKLSRGIWNPTTTEFLRPSLTTKTGFLASIIFILKMKTDLIPIPQPLLYFGIIIFFVYIKLFSLVMSMEAIFKPLENSISAVIFGHLEEIESKHLEQDSSKENEVFQVKKTD